LKEVFIDKGILREEEEEVPKEEISSKEAANELA
jgi:hypothetical protein